MAENATHPSQFDKLIGTIQFAIVALLIGAAIYCFGPRMTKESPTARDAQKEPDEKAKAQQEAERRKTIGMEALARVQDRGQEIVNAAFPQRVGAAPYRNARLEGVASKDDGYQAIVTLYYTNLLKDDNHMEVIFSFDAVGAFRGSTIGKCNDRWATPGKRIDLWQR